ncbi:MAG: hypothetical protein VX969_05125, partial [Verrucomicrobiota bacterium]|nr:hypothetical protein [Verrucomicrobiota bacterium]
EQVFSSRKSSWNQVCPNPFPEESQDKTDRQKPPGLIIQEKGKADGGGKKQDKPKNPGDYE